MDDFRWHRPVMPGQTLTVETEIADKREWDADTGLVDVAVTTFADGDRAMTMVGLVLVERRTAGPDW